MNPTRRGRILASLNEYVIGTYTGTVPKGREENKQAQVKTPDAAAWVETGVTITIFVPIAGDSYSHAALKFIGTNKKSQGSTPWLA